MAIVVVVGAGIAGLGLSAFVAARGHEVVVVERDGAPPAEADAHQEVSDWERPGVPHARQGHALLGLGIGVLRQECPEVLEDLVACGAMPVELDTGQADLGLLSRRLVFEAGLRRRVQADPHVTLTRGRVVGLVAEPTAGVPHVRGVRLDGGAEVVGDVVVDASGRKSSSATWLTGIGAAPPRETAQACGFSYIAQEFALGAGRSFPELRAPVVYELDYATVLAFPGDNGRFHLSTTVAAKDPLRTRLLDRDVYLRFLSSVDPVGDWLYDATPVGRPLPMAGLENRYRSLDAGGPVVTGFVHLGDACLQTNPTFGRGVSLALAHARVIADQIDRLDQPPRSWAEEVSERTDGCLGEWFEQQVATDAARLAELADGRKGSESLTARVLTALAVLREEDEAVRMAAERVYHMLLTPQQLMADRKVARRVLAFLREHPDIERDHVGPNRQDFERLVAAG